MPSSDHRHDHAPTPAATPDTDPPPPQPTPASARDTAVDRLHALVNRLSANTAAPLAGLVGDVAAGAGGLVVAEGRAAVLGVGQGLRDGTAAVVEGVAGAAAITGSPSAAAHAARAADLRHGWATGFAADAHGLLAGEITAHATSAAVQASPAIAAMPLGPGATAAVAAVVPAGIAATEARTAGADEAHARRRGLEAGATAAAATEVLGGAAAPVAGGVISRLLAEPIAGLDAAAQAFARTAATAADRAAADWQATHLGVPAGEPRTPGDRPSTR